MDIDLIPMKGLVLQRDISAEDALSVAHQLAELDATLQWAWARLFAAMPTIYGETYGEVVQISPYSLSSAQNMRTIAGKIHDVMIRPELSFSHHQVVCDYEMPEYQMGLFLDECATSDNGNGRVWSVAKFRELVRNRTGLPKPKSSLPHQREHDTVVELTNELGKLKEQAIEDGGVAQLATEKLERALEIIEKIDDPDIGSFAEEVREFVESPYPSYTPLRGKWGIERSNGGTYVIFTEQTPNGDYVHRLDMPECMIKDLMKRLNIKESL